MNTHSQRLLILKICSPTWTSTGNKMQFLLPFCRKALHVDTFLHRPHYEIYTYTHCINMQNTHSHKVVYHPTCSYCLCTLPTHTHLCSIFSSSSYLWRYQSSDLSPSKSAYITRNASPFFQQCYRNIMKSNLRSPTLYPSSSSSLHLPPPPPHLSRGVRDGMEGLILFRPSQPWEW